MRKAGSYINRDKFVDKWVRGVAHTLPDLKITNKVHIIATCINCIKFNVRNAITRKLQIQPF